jgi:hypothetical protein
MAPRKKRTLEEKDALTRPSLKQLWRAWCDQCMTLDCDVPPDTELTVQRTWRSDTYWWLFCQDCSKRWLRFWIVAKVHYLQVEPKGVRQQLLPLVIIDSAEDEPA